MDLDQALAFESLGGGKIRLRYAIADLEPFVEPGGPIDQEVRRRGVTVYCPDRRIPLHPQVLSEGSASLLPGQDRPAVVFEIDVDADGELLRHDVRRALIRSHHRYDYAELQAAFDAGNPPAPLAEFGAFGEARIARGIERGAITLRLPEQEAVRVDGRWKLVCRDENPTDRWNAEVSLLTGMVAAEMMVERGVGIVRTLPAPDSDALGRFRGAVKGLGIAWNRDESVAELLNGLDPARPRQMAVFDAATALMRGSSYLGFTDGVPDGDVGHGGVAARYSHVTAPLRRLGDRFALAACVAIAADTEVPGWVETAVDDVAQIMSETSQRAGQVEARCLNAVEAWVMGERIGDRFEAVVVDDRGSGVDVWIEDPSIVAYADGIRAKPGQVITLEVDDVDVDRGIIRFTQPD
jgi:exoribonuclease R